MMMKQTNRPCKQSKEESFRTISSLERAESCESRELSPTPKEKSRLPRLPPILLTLRNVSPAHFVGSLAPPRKGSLIIFPVCLLPFDTLQLFLTCLIEITLEKQRIGSVSVRDDRRAYQRKLTISPEKLSGNLSIFLETVKHKNSDKALHESFEGLLHRMNNLLSYLALFSK